MANVDNPNVVQIFDTTLRDGEQSPGASMTAEQKVIIARQLEKLGVDVIEAGFAASSDGDFDSVRRVCQEVTRPRVVSLARAQESDIERALESSRGRGKSGHPHFHRDFGYSPQAQTAHDPRAGARSRR